MRGAPLLAVACLLAAGCSSPAADAAGAVDLGVAGLDAEVSVHAEGGEVVLRFTLANNTPRTFGIRDDCASSWASYVILSKDGGSTIFPTDPVVCALYAEPGPLAPGQARTKELRWDGRTWDSGAGEGTASPGDYVARAVVRLHEGLSNASPTVQGQRDFPFRHG